MQARETPYMYTLEMSFSFAPFSKYEGTSFNDYLENLGITNKPMQNPRLTPSGRKENQGERKKGEREISRGPHSTLLVC